MFSKIPLTVPKLYYIVTFWRMGCLTQQLSYSSGAQWTDHCQSCWSYRQPLSSHEEIVPVKNNAKRHLGKVALSIVCSDQEKNMYISAE